MKRTHPEPVRLPDGRQERKDRHTLVLLGTVAAAFGMWSFLRAGLTVLLVPQAVVTELSEGEAETGRAAAFLSTMLMALADLLLRLFVGLSAMKEGRGRHRGRGYLVIATLLVILQVSSVGIVVAAISIARPEIETLTPAAVAMLVELTSIIILIHLIHTARRVRKQRGKQE